MAGYLSPERFAAVMQRQKQGNPDWRLTAIRKGLLSPYQRAEIDKMILELAAANEQREAFEKASSEHGWGHLPRSFVKEG